MDHSTPIQAEDLVPVHSRVNWGAIFAGAVIALALYFFLTLLGGAIGLSVSGHVRPSSVGMGAAVWAVLTTVLALFVGGWAASQLTIGENKTEAFMHGVILWGVLFSMLLWLMASGVRGGFNAMVGMAQAGGATAQGTTADDWEAAARRAGISQETINAWRGKATDASETARRAAEDTQTQQETAEAVTRVTWWSVLGTLLSMVAAVAGSLLGKRPTFRLVGFRPQGGAALFERAGRAEVAARH